MVRADMELSRTPFTQVSPCTTPHYRAVAPHTKPPVLRKTTVQMDYASFGTNPDPEKLQVIAGDERLRRNRFTRRDVHCSTSEVLLRALPEALLIALEE